MLKFDDELKVYLARNPVDFRKSIDGLSVIVVDLLEHNPQSSALFVFYNKAKDKLKLLAWHRNGFVMLYKRLEKGRFKLGNHLKGNGSFELSVEQLHWLLAGLDFENLMGFPELNVSNYC